LDQPIKQWVEWIYEELVPLGTTIY
jgi:hypothetical protein